MRFFFYLLLACQAFPASEYSLLTDMRYPPEKYSFSSTITNSAESSEEENNLVRIGSILSLEDDDSLDEANYIIGKGISVSNDYYTAGNFMGMLYSVINEERIVGSVEYILNPCCAKLGYSTSRVWSEFFSVCGYQYEEYATITALITHFDKQPLCEYRTCIRPGYCSLGLPSI